jgi:hypothetical protein
MPTNVPGNPAATYPANITVPVTGDPRVPSSVATPLTQLADRTAIADARLDLIDPDQVGVQLLRRYDTPALLRASTVHTDGTCVLVGFLGLYIYQSSSGLTDDGQIAIKPNDVGGSGRWVYSLYSSYGQANGIAYMNAAAKVDPSQMLDGVRARSHYYSASPLTMSSATHIDMTGATASISGVQVGDIITVEYSFGVIPASGSSVSLRPRMTDPGGTFTIYDDISILPGLGTSTEQIATGTFHIPCVVAGTQTVFWQWKSFSGGTATVLRRSMHLFARVV